MLWLMANGTDCPSEYRFVLPILLISVIISFAWAMLKRRKEIRQKGKYLLLPLAGTIVILLSGTIFEEMPNLSFTVTIGLVITLLLAGFTICKTTGIWPLSISASILILWYSFGCWLVCAMSITGDWL